MKQGKTSWSSPANIALVKYWGKHGDQLPSNPSLSMTLSASVSQTSVAFEWSPDLQPEVLYRYDSKPKPGFETRVRQYIERLKPEIPWLGHTRIEINSLNTFPHSSGISSSAAFMSSLALSLCQIERWLDNNYQLDNDFYRKASHVARLGSGSAARSVYGGFSLWGRADFIGSSDDRYAIPFTESMHQVFGDMYDAILIISSGMKSLSSSAGHALMNQHPYRENRFKRANHQLERLAAILRSGDQAGFVSLIEEEAMELHGLIMSSEGGPILLEPATIAAIRAIRRFRSESGCQLGFSLDAGPNLHLIYTARDREQDKSFIQSDLLQYCEGGRWIDDRMGNGPRWHEADSILPDHA